ncbi:UDP-N-acetylmuramate dehydrogenase [Candidatus Saccharibacteria bacterium]|nr:UDP-N-acetylmuramate dehydrogenase [Candidatus Saccharibacteria bacterium]
MEIREGVPIAELTTMRIGGEARYVVEIRSEEEAKEAWEFAKEKGLPIWVMGGGANTIGRDEGYSGVIFLNKIRGLEIRGEEVVGGGGEIWDEVVLAACSRGLSGIEALAKIPGTLGAAPVQNIGAYGQEVKNVLEKVRVLDLSTGGFREFSMEELQFSYRKSILNSGETRGRYFVTRVWLKLNHERMKPPFYTSLQRYVEEHQVSDFSPMSIYNMVSEIRGEKLPDPKEIASAGSFFKNIYVSGEEALRLKKLGVLMWEEGDGYKINSGWLIENAGLKGKVFHGFLVSEKAALILINESGESFSDLMKAKEEISGAVEKKYGLKLEMEPVII